MRLVKFVRELQDKGLIGDIDYNNLGFILALAPHLFEQFRDDLSPDGQRRLDMYEKHASRNFLHDAPQNISPASAQAWHASEKIFDQFVRNPDFFNGKDPFETFRIVLNTIPNPPIDTPTNPSVDIAWKDVEDNPFFYDMKSTRDLYDYADQLKAIRNMARNGQSSAAFPYFLRARSKHTLDRIKHKNRMEQGEPPDMRYGGENVESVTPPQATPTPQGKKEPPSFDNAVQSATRHLAKRDPFNSMPLGTSYLQAATRYLQQRVRKEDLDNQTTPPQGSGRKYSVPVIHDGGIDDLILGPNKYMAVAGSVT